MSYEFKSIQNNCTAYRECYFVVINQIRRSDKPRRTVIVTTAEHFDIRNLLLEYLITFDFFLLIFVIFKVINENAQCN